MQVEKLTKSTVDAIAVPERSEGGQSRVEFLFERLTPGFGVRTTSNGVKSFIWQGRVNGRKQRHTIGRAGAISVELARKQAQKLAGEVATGLDPRQEKSRRRSAGVTLEQATEAYVDSRELKSTTLRDVERFKKELSDWMARPIVEISREMVAQRHNRIGKRSKAGANRCMRYLRAILNFASEAYAFPDGQPLLVDNPVNRLTATRSWFRVAPKRRVLTSHELPKWLQAVNRLPDPPPRMPGEGKQLPTLKNGETARDFFLTLVLTGLRRSEALNLRWVDVNLEEGVFTVSETKNHRAHTLPLTTVLRDVFSRRSSQADPGEYVFTNKDGSRFSNLRYPLKRIEKLSGIYVTCHDLRRTFATVAESLDIPAYAVKALLNHKTSGDVTAGYIQITPDRLRHPMQKVTDYILSAGNQEG